MIEILRERWNRDAPLRDLVAWLKKEMDNYDNQEWWLPFVEFDPERYTRKVLYTEENMEFVLISWLPSQTTFIHGHPSGGCLFRVLYGELREDRFEQNDMVYENKAITTTNVNYIDDSMGFHRVYNISFQPCISFHVYSPPISQK